MHDYYPMADITKLKKGDYVFHRLTVGNYIVKSVNIEKDKVEVIEYDPRSGDKVFWIEAAVLTTQNPEGEEVNFDKSEEDE